MKVLFLAFLLFSFSSYGQEQLAIRLNENGLMKIMQLAVKYNTGETGNRTLIIPQNIYKFTIKQKDLAANPIIKIVNEISDLNFNKNLDFFLHTTAINVTAMIDQKSLVTEIISSRPDGFDLKLSINSSKITLSGANVSLCEDRLRNAKKCGPGLKAKVTDLKVTTFNQPVVLSSIIRVLVKKGLASVKVLSVNSNLESSKPPKIDINFSSLEIPRIAIVIDGQETELDTTTLREQILERKDFLGKKILAFAGDFITNDLAEMINIYLNNTNIATTLQVYRRNEAAAYNDLDDNGDYQLAAIDNTYVRPPIIFGTSTQQAKTPAKPVEATAYRPATYKAVADNTYVKMPIMNNYTPEPAKDVMKILMDQFTHIVKHAQVDLSLKAISTPLNKDIELAGVLNFVLNNTVFKVKNTLGNSTRTLPALNLSQQRHHDINLAISEPVINGALDLANSTGLFNDLLEKITDVDGFSLTSLKLHFTHSNSINAIANVAIDLKKIRSSIWKDPLDWATTGIGVWLERNNNNSVIYFPLQFEIIPVVEINAVTDKSTLIEKVNNATKGEISLGIKIKSVFNGDQLMNTYGYPSNVGSMFKIVRTSVLERLHGQLDQYSDQTFNIDLKKVLNQSGVEFVPKSISFNQAAYMILNLDIKDIKFNSKNPTKK